MSLPEDRFLSPSFDGDALTKERKDNMKKDKELVKGVNQVMTLSQCKNFDEEHKQVEGRGSCYAWQNEPGLYQRPADSVG